jgi:hypothetical protein
VDEDLAPVIRHDLGKSLKTIIGTVRGVYAITGNHEYIGGCRKAVAYLENHGIKGCCAILPSLLETVSIWQEEKTVTARGSAGNRVKRSRRYSGESIHRKPVILMDHQPFHSSGGKSATTSICNCRDTRTMDSYGRSTT